MIGECKNYSRERRKLREKKKSCGDWKNQGKEKRR